MLSTIRSKLFHKNIVLLYRSIWIGRPCFISEKAFQKFKLKQARMQCNDGLPVYLKCGRRDKILLWMSVGSTLYCFIMNLKKLKEVSDKYD